jgi:hypothetical protein
MIHQKRTNLYTYLLVWLFTCLCLNTIAQQTVNNIIDQSGKSTNLDKYLTEKTWNELFPNRDGLALKSNTSAKKNEQNDFYSFKAFLAAAAFFPQFLSAEDTIIQKRELCAFLASMAYETGGGWDHAPGGYFKWGLYYKEEKGCENGCPQYTDHNKPNYLPVDSQSYHGRGPLQISWNYNYGQFSEAFFGSKEKLLKNPGLVAADPVLAFASAIWFWVTPQFPKPSCHAVMNNTWKPSERDIAGGRLPGFGTVVNVINGGIECDRDTLPTTAYRYGYYQFFCHYFNVPPGENTACTTQKPFGQ